VSKSSSFSSPAQFLEQRETNFVQTTQEERQSEEEIEIYERKIKKKGSKNGENMSFNQLTRQQRIQMEQYLQTLRQKKKYDHLSR